MSTEHANRVAYVSNSSRLEAHALSVRIAIMVNDRVILNVGGQMFHTTMETLAHGESSMLSAMVSGHWKESSPTPSDEIFIDRDGTHFRYILNYYRGGAVLYDFANSQTDPVSQAAA